MSIVRFPLSGGRAKEQDAHVLINAEDFDRINDRGPWYLLEGGYAFRHETINGRSLGIYLHRVIMDAPPHLYVDHIDGDKLNCTRENLRLCTPEENARNTAGYGLLPYRGVSWMPSVGKYEVSLYNNGQRQSLGYFDDIQEAALAYDRAAVGAYGEFARTNFAPDHEYTPLKPIFDPPEVFTPFSQSTRTPKTKRKQVSLLGALLIRKYRSNGMTYKEIGNRLGLSESGAHRAVNSRWAKLNEVAV